MRWAASRRAGTIATVRANAVERAVRRRHRLLAVTRNHAAFCIQYIDFSI